MAMNTAFQAIASHSMRSAEVDAPEPGFPTTSAMAATSTGPSRDFTQGGTGRHPDSGGPWIGCCEQAGVIEIHDPRLLRPGQEAFCRALVEAAVGRFEARRAEVRLASSTCRLEFEPGRFDRTELARRAGESVRAATPAVRERSGGRPGWTILTASATAGGVAVRAWREDSPHGSATTKRPIGARARSRRLTDLAMAGGSLALAVGGVILPGVPTLPFVIMSGRYAVRVSPRIEQLLTRQRWCAALLAEPETSCGPRSDGRSLSRTIGPAVLFAAALLMLHPPLPVVLALELGLMAFLAWRELGKTGYIDSERGAVA